jgi:hypothetical protein
MRLGLQQFGYPIERKIACSCDSGLFLVPASRTFAMAATTAVGHKQTIATGRFAAVGCSDTVSQDH